MNSGFMPRGKLPKTNDVPTAAARYFVARQRATPPPMSLPWTAAEDAESFRMEVARSLHYEWSLRLAILSPGVSLLSRRPPVQKCAPAPYIARLPRASRRAASWAQATQSSRSLSSSGVSALNWTGSLSSSRSTRSQTTRRASRGLLPSPLETRARRDCATRNPLNDCTKASTFNRRRLSELIFSTRSRHCLVVCTREHSLDARGQSGSDSTRRSATTLIGVLACRWHTTTTGSSQRASANANGRPRRAPALGARA